MTPALHVSRFSRLYKSLLVSMLVAGALCDPTYAADLPSPGRVASSIRDSLANYFNSWRNRHERALTGTWVSFDTSGGAAAGRMHLFKARRVKLEPMPIGPITLQPFEGTWSADARTIRIVIPERGTAEFDYTLSKDRETLDVRYANAMTQRFHRENPPARHGDSPAGENDLLP